MHNSSLSLLGKIDDDILKDPRSLSYTILKLFGRRQGRMMEHGMRDIISFVKHITPKIGENKAKKLKKQFDPSWKNAYRIEDEMNELVELINDLRDRKRIMNDQTANKELINLFNELRQRFENHMNDYLSHRASTNIHSADFLKIKAIVDIIYLIQIEM